MCSRRLWFVTENQLTNEDDLMADNERRKPVPVAARNGRPPIPDPVPADYRQEIPDEIFDLIDEKCDQETLARGKQLSKFEW